MSLPHDSFDNPPASFLTDDIGGSPDDFTANQSAVPAATPASTGNRILGGLVYGIAGLVVAATVVVFVSPSLAAKAANLMPASMVGSTAPVAGGGGSCCSAGGCSMARDAALVSAPSGQSSCGSAQMTGGCSGGGDAATVIADGMGDVESDPAAELTEVTETTGDAVDQPIDDTVQTDAVDGQPNV